jgi:hypothetical protein
MARPVYPVVAGRRLDVARVMIAMMAVMAAMITMRRIVLRHAWSRSRGRSDHRLRRISDLRRWWRGRRRSSTRCQHSNGNKAKDKDTHGGFLLF